MYVQILRGQEYPGASRVPGACSRCHSDRRPMAGEPDGKEPILDIGINVEYEGAVYYCLSCFRELQSVVEKEFPDKRVDDAHAARRRDGLLVKSLREELAAEAAARAAQAEQIETLRAEINALRKR